MTKMTIVQAICDGMRVALKTDPSVIVLGEDVGKNGGVFRATDGLWEEFGDERVIDTPLAEAGIVGTSIGLAVNGFRPVAEIQFMGFIYPAFEQIVTHAARLRTRTQGVFPASLVIRAPYGGGIRAPELHCDSTESLFVHIPGLKVVVPSTPSDAKGLLLAAIKDPDPVIFLEPMRIYRSVKEEVPEGWFEVPLGKARRVREGDDLSVFAWGAMVPIAEKAAREWEQKGVSCDVIDLRTLYPLDEETIIESIKKTGRAVIVHEAPKTAGLGAELIALIQEHAFLYLEAPIARVTGYDAPVPMFALEDHFLPGVERVSQAIGQVASF
ncbi:MULTISPECIES: alpha-ketoacid dehydrogenase subunit beta [Thermoactinomyces]|jgi:2-oxoisovalerate dehydrogenase E1 component beta subunit|uniref:Alpha-ketoacid dehydrogenase subunit beta n=1 Tax=Thermoactinomyces daqus TaxID=1329516 RepID=A0A7W1X9R6_9BACL|nr:MULTISPECIES: alpha-ketoacid dehydrogenase subunit beta [Thermoactinomyces]MBA4542732.1 alpha-ketoacid dehydrogenase subunit beta [Thermoactinomyces daqus]MBH8598597.1 alpha-ketoacid dehydrogenase subunit beta [Thermoactinomyces sp. CICC 10523]MBH8604559.1 alpha-ketoacid dehydrogenase subunit beta [Thermoactinomyces sp. CICC 10522]MBH8606981.1 alpha-ketoacid dehydrogenase subunit beta [Thermoactinomyces sp. CICC 10521]